MKKLLILLVSIFMVASTFGASASAEDEQWPIPNEPDFGHHSLLIDDGDSNGSGFSFLQMSDGNNQYLCNSISDAKCKNAQMGRYQAYLPKCSNADDFDCIDSLVAIDQDGKVFPGVLKDYVYGNNHPNKFVGDGKLTPLHAADPSVWSLPGAPHSFGDEYVLFVGLTNGVDRARENSSEASFSINLFPVSRLATGLTQPDINGFANYPKCNQLVAADGRSYIGCGSGAQEFGNYRCAAKMIENGTCLLRHAFPENLRFKVSVRLKNEPAAMLHGRLRDPLIDIIRKENSLQIEVEAGSVRVPILYSGDQYNKLPGEIKDYWDNCLANRTCGFSTRQATGNVFDDPNRRNVQDYAESYGKRVLALVPLFSKAVQDKSVAAPSSWNIRTLSQDQMRTSANCFKRGTGFIGVVTTNSTTYSEGPPEFNDGTLTYKVASLHYLPSGDVFKGTYNLILRSDVARCLYGFSSAPISASISVISADGQAQVATTVVNERKNWLYLSANGFTFSAPSIQVRLSQETPVVEPTPTPTPTPSATTVAKVKKTITCVKGKTTKKVSGTNPKCPTGYKKKG